MTLVLVFLIGVLVGASIAITGLTEYRRDHR